MLKTLESLIELARLRKNNPVSDSYTNKLLSDKSLSKEKVLEASNTFSLLSDLSLNNLLV